jgi:hypothetical protein
MSGHNKPSANNLALYAALAKAQGEFTPVIKTAPGSIGAENHVRYFDYADMAALIGATRPALTANGLSVTQPTRNGPHGFELATILTHKDGGSIESVVPLRPPRDPIQAFGSELTYQRRYQYQTLLGLIGEGADDPDADLTALADPGPEPESAPNPDMAKAPKDKPPCPDGYIDANLDKWTDAIQGGKRTSAQVIANVRAKYELSDEQQQRISAIVRAEGQ